MKRFLSMILIIVMSTSLLPAKYSYAAEYTPKAVKYYNGHKYALYDISLNWFEAKLYCESLGGHLVVITSKQEQENIEDLIMSGKCNVYWAGASDDKIEGQWTWITDETWSYSNWYYGEPNNDLDGTENYLELYNKTAYRKPSRNPWNDRQFNENTENRGFICEWGDTSNVNDYIIQQVSKYTSDDLYNTFDFILSSNYSDDVKLQALTEVTSNYGITDPKEGITYLSNTTPHRMNYRYLTTDEIYCAYNFGNYIATNLAARSALYIDGLLFNGEINDYIGIVTGTETDTPGVQKYKKMLKDFMTDGHLESEIISQAKKMSDFFDNFLKINNIENENLKKISNDIGNSTSNNAKNNLVKQFSETLAKTNAGKTLKLNGEDFSKFISNCPDYLSFTLNAAEDVIAIANMKEQIEIYSQYSSFLYTIYTHTDVNREMRIAAKKLYDEIENGYFSRIESILMNSVELTTKFFDVNLFKSLIGKLGSEAFDTINLAAFIVNIFVNVGDFVEQAAYTQGYAELSALYSLKLREDAANFKANKTAANAWQFFEDYNLLWKLRYKGEEQFLEMSSIKGLFNKVEFKEYNYSAKENIVNDTLNHLKKSKFEYTNYELPQSMQYLSKSVMSCPVNVYVYNQNGELIAELLDGIECDITNEYGRFAVVYKPYTNEYSKVICQSTDDELSIRAEAISDGLVNYETASINNNNLYTFDNVNIYKGNIISTADSAGYTIYDDELDGVGKQYSLNEINTEIYVPVESITINNKKEITLNMGDSYVFDVTLSPANASNRGIEWISDNEDILIVQNGVATALREGCATIYARASDSYEVIDSMEINVAPANLTLSSNSVKVNSSIGSLIVAGYKNGELIKLETINGYEGEVSGYEDCDYIKAFLWYNEENILTALCESKKTIIH